MTTQPVPEILTRELRNDRLLQVLSQLSSGLEETVNFGTHILNWFVGVGSPERHRIVFAMLLRHYLELLDAVSILVRNSSIDPCKLVLRSMLEILFSFKYLFQSDTQLRASAFLVAYVSKVLNEYRKVDSAAMKSTQTDNSTWSSNIALLESELAFQEHSQAVLEYGRLKESGKTNPPWFSFYNGPKNIEQLANRLGLSTLYESFYRSWSGPLHGTDIFANRLDSDGKGGTLIVQIRFVKDAQWVTANALNVSIDLYGSFVQHLLPQHMIHFKTWFQGIHDFGSKVTGQDFVTVTFKPPASGV